MVKVWRHFHESMSLLIHTRDQNLHKFANWTGLIDGPHFQANGDINDFDCCFAGNARHCLGQGLETARNVQAMVAADEKQFAFKAFQGTFTKLLTEALRRLRGSTFTPAELFANIDKRTMQSVP